MDYISREDAIDICCRNCLGCYLNTETKATYCRSIKELTALPAADVVERKKGKWRISRCAGGANCKCSNCKFEIIFSWVRVDPYNYCPNCGAKMEG